MDELTGLIAVGTGYAAILMPVLLLWVIFYYVTKGDKAKYDALVEISKNLENESDVKDLLESFKEEKKPIDYKCNGAIVIFVGLGLFIFGIVSSINILNGIGIFLLFSFQDWSNWNFQSANAMIYQIASFAWLIFGILLVWFSLGDYKEYKDG